MQRRRFLGLLGLAACRGGSTTTGPSPTTPKPVAVPWRIDTAGSPSGDMLRLINAYRRAAGVSPVVLDPGLTRGCVEHARYMVLNQGKPQLYSTNAHVQDPALPGASPAGAACGRAANLYQRVDDLQTAVHDFVAGLYHRVPILSPRLDRIGLGTAPARGGGLAVALRFAYSDGASPRAVLYPADGQRDVPVLFPGESPNPVPPPTIFAGYPITLQFPTGDRITHVRASLRDANGTVPVFLSSPERPARSDTPQRHLVGLMAREPLRASSTYTATIHANWNGRATTWTTRFTTVARTRVDPMDPVELAAHVGRPVVLRGRVDRASKISEGTVRLTLPRLPAGGPVTLVAIDVPMERLHALTRRPLHELSGLRVEVESTPRLSFGSLNLRVMPGRAFRLAR